MNVISVLVNNEPVYEFSRDIILEKNQLAFLDKMDSDMTKGFKIQGKLIQQPDATQCATFVAMNLIKALQQGNESVINSSCAYLITRKPALIEVRADDFEKSVKVELIEEPVQ